MVVRRRRPHQPVHWVQVGKKTGFVPAHPGDQKDKPPVNLKHGMYTVASAGGGEHIERIGYDPKEKVEPLTVAPKQFRTAAYPQLAKTEPPKIEARLVADAATNAKSTDAKRNEVKITYDYGKGTFVRSGVEVGGRTTKPVVVGGLNSRGGFSDPGGRGSAGRSVEGGYRDGGAAGGAGRETSAGRSGGLGGEATSRGGGGSSSAGSSSGGSGGSSGSGGRPK